MGHATKENASNTARDEQRDGMPETARARTYVIERAVNIDILNAIAHDIVIDTLALGNDVCKHPEQTT